MRPKYRICLVPIRNTLYDVLIKIGADGPEGMVFELPYWFYTTSLADLPAIYKVPWVTHQRSVIIGQYPSYTL